MTSVCVLYYAYGDTKLLMRLIDEGEGTREQKDHNRANLRRVVQYCMNETDCRRSQVLQYFGEQFPREQCHKTCDNCMAPKNVELRDVTGLAKDAMGLVKAIQKDKGVTMLYAIDVFRGSKTQKVRSHTSLASRFPRCPALESVPALTPLTFCRPAAQIAQAGHDKLEHAGKGANIDRGDAERLFQLLAAEQILGERYERNGLGFTNAYVTLGPRAQQLLAGKLQLQLGFTKGGKGARAAGAVAGSSAAAAKGKGKATGTGPGSKGDKEQQQQRTINESFDHEEYGGEFMDELLDEVEGVYDANEEEWCVPSPLPVLPPSRRTLVADTVRITPPAQGRLRPPPRAQVDRRRRQFGRPGRQERHERRHHGRTPRPAHRPPRAGASWHALVSGRRDEC